MALPAEAEPPTAVADRAHPTSLEKPVPRIALVLPALCLGLLLPSAVPSGPVSAAPKAPPARHVETPGRLIAAEVLTGAAALPDALVTYLIRYASTSAADEPVRVTGTVSIPQGTPPAGGWPVLSWAHGTTGTADVCAPSRDTPTGPAHDYLGRINATLSYWVAQGYVVAQTDYEGLGSSGPHPYLNGVSESNGVIDIVRAARELDERIASTWFTAGHSQGGQAALFTAARAQQRAPELSFLGAAAMAPASGLNLIIDAGLQGSPGTATFLPLILNGAAAVDPAVRPKALLNKTGRELQRVAKDGCIAQLREASAGLTLQQILAPDADLSPLRRVLAANEPAAYPPDVPVLILQGTADAVVPQSLTDLLVPDLCRQDVPLQYKTYAGVDHRGVVEASVSDVQAWLAQRLNGQVPATTCGTS